MADLHLSIERDRQYADVGELQRQLVAPSGVDEARSAVDQQSVTDELHFYPRSAPDVVRYGHALVDRAKCELAEVRCFTPPIPVEVWSCNSTAIPGSSVQ